MTPPDAVLPPPECTLPTPEQPLRLAEFDQLFGTALRRQDRPTPTRLRWEFDAAAEARAGDLVGRESECCSFFRFTVAPVDGLLRVDVEVPERYADVLDALAERADARIRR